MLNSPLRVSDIGRCNFCATPDSDFFLFKKTCDATYRRETVHLMDDTPLLVKIEVSIQPHTEQAHR